MHTLLGKSTIKNILLIIKKALGKLWEMGEPKVHDIVAYSRNVFMYYNYNLINPIVPCCYIASRHRTNQIRKAVFPHVDQSLVTLLNLNHLKVLGMVDMVNWNKECYLKNTRRKRETSYRCWEHKWRILSDKKGIHSLNTSLDLTH